MSSLIASSSPSSSRTAAAVSSSMLFRKFQLFVQHPSSSSSSSSSLSSIAAVASIRSLSSSLLLSSSKIPNSNIRSSSSNNDRFFFPGKGGGATAAAAAASTSSATRSSSSSSTNTTSSPIKLHYEWIPTSALTTLKDNGNNINSNNDHDHDHDYTILFLHGLLGNGRNLKTLCRNVVKQQSSSSSSGSGGSVVGHGRCRGGILMDLRGHGKSYQTQKEQRVVNRNIGTGTSTSADDDCSANNPSTFLECVKDIDYTLNYFHANPPTATAKPTPILSQPPPTSVIVGHSFGGRLALEYAYDLVRRRQEQQEKSSSSLSLPSLKAVWLLDTVPGEANNSVDEVLGIITDVMKKNTNSSSLIDKKEMVNVLTNPPYELDIGTAQWLAMSYDDNDQNGGDFGFDNDLVTRLKPEFSNQDFMGMLRYILSSNNDDNNNNNNDNITVHLVRAGKNPGWTIPIISELESLIKEYSSSFHMHVLSKAGHNVHVDDMHGLVRLFATGT